MMTIDRRAAAPLLAALLLFAGAFRAPDAGAGERLSGRSLAAGQYRIAGHAPTCRDARTFLSHQLQDFGAALPGMIVLNPDRLSRLPVDVRLFVYAHECGHLIYGASEAAADCLAARRGGREGWLTDAALVRLCRILPAEGKGPAYAARDTRCDIIRACRAGLASPEGLAGSRTYGEAALALGDQ